MKSMFSPLVVQRILDTIFIRVYSHTIVLCITKQLLHNSLNIMIFPKEKMYLSVIKPSFIRIVNLAYSRGSIIF